MIQLHNVYYKYPSKTVALDNISLSINKGDLTAIIGGNGVGKSTLLNIISGTIKPTQGIIHKPKDLTFSHLVQSSQLDHLFPFKVFDVVQMGLWPRHGYLKAISADDKKRVYQAIEHVGLTSHAARQIGSLSGGQFQRMLFARLILQDADCILLDEPFSALDTPTIHDLMNILKDWHTLGKTIIAIMHDLNFVYKNFPKTILLERQLIDYGSTQDILKTKNLKKTLYHRLIDS